MRTSQMWYKFNFLENIKQIRDKGNQIVTRGPSYQLLQKKEQN